MGILKSEFIGGVIPDNICNMSVDRRTGEMCTS